VDQPSPLHNMFNSFNYSDATKLSKFDCSSRRQNSSSY